MTALQVSFSAFYLLCFLISHPTLHSSLHSLSTTHSEQSAVILPRAVHLTCGP
jgi:hypothetical protein